MSGSDAPLSLVICPACHYGFPDRDPEVTELVCPRRECAHRWEVYSETIRAVHGEERREARPELVVTAGASPRRLELPVGETIIGRDPDCAFEIDNRTASRRHARIVRTGSRVTIEDLQSSCGTIVNDQFIEAVTTLTAHDEIVIGGTVLRLAVRFVASSSRPEIADSAAVLARGQRASAPQFEGRATDVVPLKLNRITIGRSLDRDLVLPDPMLSGKHALLERYGGDWFLSDVQSRIGTFVNGQSVIRTKLASGDRLQFGPYLFRFDGDRLTRIVQPASFGLVADEIVKTAGSVTLLDHIQLVLQPGEFVGLIGPSGAGKTTLLDALNGLRPATSGRVLVNGEPLYEQYDRLRHHIGYVPQDDIIHRELTVRQALVHAARLRLPEDVAADELQRVVEETLETLQMSHRADVPITQLSGGQRKRVSVGVELLSRPGILFLDEPTSGLDPGTETHLMKLFRRLADQGRTVICTTHVMENVDLFHKLVVLAPGGKLAYFGPPQAAKGHFGVARFTDLYEQMETKTPDEWQEQYRTSRICRELLDDERGNPQKAGESRRKQERPTNPRSGSKPKSRSVSLGHQWLALLRRTGDLWRADRAGLALLIAQPVFITGLICLVCSELPTIVFLLVISALWFGCSNAAQQIVKERAIYRRERMVNLRLDAYLLSKFVPLVAVGAVQSVLMLGLMALCEESVRAFEMVAAAVLMATWCGASMGLIISALASNPDKAMSIVPLSLIPQIILAGVLVPLPEMNAPTRWLSYAVAARWANQAGEVGLLQGATIDAKLVQNRAWTRPLWNLYPDYDFNDVESQHRFLADHIDKQVFRHEWWLLDEVVLAGFLLGQLLLTTAILRSQDVL